VWIDGNQELFRSIIRITAWGWNYNFVFVLNEGFNDKNELKTFRTLRLRTKNMPCKACTSMLCTSALLFSIAHRLLPQ